MLSSRSYFWLLFRVSISRYFLKHLPFKHSQVLAWGALLGSTVLHQLFNITAKKNFMLLSANIDSVNHKIQQISQSELFGALQQQSMMVSMKELYGWLCIVSLISLLFFFLKESSIRPGAIHPKFKTIRKAIKHQLKIDRQDV